MSRFFRSQWVRRTRRRPAGYEKWTWRAGFAGSLLATVSVVADYYTPWTEQAFVVLTLPGPLLSLVALTALGVQLLNGPIDDADDLPAVAQWSPDRV